MGWFSSSSTPAPSSSQTPSSEFSDLAPSNPSGAVSASESESIKKAIIRQILIESNTANARGLIEKMNESCFERCIPNPGASVSSAESTCVTQCMEKYMSAFNQVHATYRRRIQQEAAGSGGGF